MLRTVANRIDVHIENSTMRLETEDLNGRPGSASRWLIAQANLRALATIEAW